MKINVLSGALFDRLLGVQNHATAIRDQSQELEAFAIRLAQESLANAERVAAQINEQRSRDRMELRVLRSERLELESALNSALVEIDRLRSRP